MAQARTKSFRDHNGNRFIFPSFIMRDGDDGAMSPTDVILRAMEMKVILDLESDDGWFEFDTEKLPHVRSIACSPKFAHGGATVLIFEGPEYDEAVREAEAAA